MKYTTDQMRELGKDTHRPIGEYSIEMMADALDYGAARIEELENAVRGLRHDNEAVLHYAVQLETALRPFADVADYVGTTPPGITDSEMYLWTHSEGRSGIVHGITKAHVIAARAALETEKP